MGKVEDVSERILMCLLQDFQAKELNASALEEEYEGVQMSDLKQKCFVNDHTCTIVDFDLALKGLEDNGLIGTGPMEVYKNPPASTIVFVGLVSKREYVYLTAKGYKAAR